MKNGTKLNFDKDENTAELMIGEKLIEISMERKAKNDKYSRIRHKIEDLLDQRRLAEEYMPFDEHDY